MLTLVFITPSTSLFLIYLPSFVHFFAKHLQNNVGFWKIGQGSLFQIRPLETPQDKISLHPLPKFLLVKIVGFEVNFSMRYHMMTIRNIFFILDIVIIVTQAIKINIISLVISKWIIRFARYIIPRFQ